MNPVEIQNLTATPLAGAVKLTWAVSSTSYLQSFLVVVTKNGTVTNRISVPVTAREATVTCEGTGYTFNVEAIVAEGGKTATANPLPIEPSPATANLVGANGAYTKLQMQQLKARGANVTRVDEGEAHAQFLNLESVTQAAVEAGMKIIWITFQPETDACLAEYMLLAATQKAAVAAIEYLNEVDPEGVGNDHSGHEYRRMFCRERNRWNAGAPGVILLPQVSNAGKSKAWAEDFFAPEGHAELKEALAGPAGCHIAMHPTGYDETTPLKNVNGYLENTASTPTATSWAFQRFMSVAATVRAITGVTPTMWMTEFTHQGGTGKWGEMAARMQAMFKVFIACNNGTAPASWLPAALAGVPPRIVPVWYDAFNGSENQGMMTSSGGIQPEGVTGTFEAMAKAFLNTVSE